MPRDGVEADGQCDVGRGADEAKIENVRQANDDRQRFASHDIRNIDDISDRRIAAIELDQDIGSVRCDSA